MRARNKEHLLDLLARGVKGVVDSLSSVTPPEYISDQEYGNYVAARHQIEQALKGLVQLQREKRKTN